MKHKFLSIALLMIMSVANSFSQDAMPCGTIQPPTESIILSPERAMALAADNTVRVIPCVFHIVYFDNADSALFAGGINNQRIAIQMQVMNDCFRKRNADTAQTVAQFRAIAADSKIEFCLKEVRYKKTTVTPYFPPNDQMKYLPTGSPAVEPLKYLNIWVCRLNNCPNPCNAGIGGYAYFPQSNTVGQPFDGVVSHLTYVGNDDRRTGEVTVHEIGHYLGLPHTFCNGTCSCANSCDGIFDTPCTDAPAGGCNLTRVACGGLTNNQNYMEYTDCSTMFTVGQSAVMTATLLGLRNALWTSGLCSGTPNNQPPSVMITSPTNGQTFPAPANITINVTASDADGTIARVEFYNGATLINSDQTAPYSFTWTNVAAGNYVLTAKATDNANATSTSAPVNVVVGTGNQPPTCILTNPANNATIVLPAPVQIGIIATDADGSITKVDIYYNTNSLLISLPFPQYSSPISLSWYAGVGTYKISAKAYDNSGLVTTSAIANITVTNQTNPPPTVSITTNGTSFTAPATVIINATATDNTGISRVEFYRGSTLLNTDASAPYSFTWNNVPVGNYVITARAYDTQNASSVSAPINITVISGEENIIRQWVQNNKLFTQTNIRTYSVVIQPNP